MGAGQLEYWGPTPWGSKAPICKDPTLTALFSFLQSPGLNRFQICLNMKYLWMWSAIFYSQSQRDTGGRLGWALNDFQEFTQLSS